MSLIKSRRFNGQRRGKGFVVLLILILIFVLIIIIFSNDSLKKWNIKKRNEINSSIKLKSLEEKEVEMKMDEKFYFSPYQFERENYWKNRKRSEVALNYSVELFQSLKTIPIVWIDENRQTRWNEAAEKEFYFYLVEKQFFKRNSLEKEIDQCLENQFLILNQHEAGFFSRHNCFLDQFCQTLYSPSMSLLTYRSFHVSNSNQEDFLSQGILRYFLPLSTCSKLIDHPRMKIISQRLKSDSHQSTLNIHSMEDLLYPNQLKSKAKFFFYTDFWSFSCEDLPHRHYLFDFNRSFSPINYFMSLNDLLNHSQENLYASPSISADELNQWEMSNPPYGKASQSFSSKNASLSSWKDRLFLSFVRSMLILYFHHFPLRISRSVEILYDHWSNYLRDRNNETLNDMAAIFIRRGDKMPEDSFWLKYHRWRNISFYVKPLIDQEQIQKRRFSSIFVMTDDSSVMDSILNYSHPKSEGSDETYARQHLKGRTILYNVLAPQSCFNPFIRIGFDQFLASLQFLVQYSQLTVSHSDSNVGRYLEQFINARKQRTLASPYYPSVVQAVDSF